MPQRQRDPLIQSLLMFKLREQASLEAEQRAQRDRALLREANQLQSASDREKANENALLSKLADEAIRRTKEEGGDMGGLNLSALPEQFQMGVGALAKGARLDRLGEDFPLAATGDQATKFDFSRRLAQEPEFTESGESQQAAFARMLGREGTRQARVAEEQRVDLRQKGRESAQSAGITLNKEQTKDMVKNLGAARAHLVLNPGDQRTEAGVQQVEETIRRNNTAGQAAVLLARADGEKEAFLAREFATSLTPEGRDPQQRLHSALVEISNWEQGKGAEPSANTWVRASMGKFAFQDPRTAEWVSTGGTPDGPKQREVRRSQYELGLRLNDLVDTYLDVRADAKRTGGLVGLDTPQEILRAFGEENPKAAAYGVAMREYISILLKARQGSRPSDWDFRLYMALVPSLTETLSDSGIARLDQSIKSYQQFEQSLNTPAFQERVKEYKRLYPTSVLERRIERKLMEVNRAFEAGDTLAQANAMKDFEKLREEWVASGRADEISKSIFERSPVDALTPEEMAESDRMMLQGGP